MRYFAFIDDSGTKEYGANPEAYSNAGNSRYFVFGSVVLTEDAAATLGGRIAELKRDCFGTADVEIKSNWLRIPKEKERKYLVPYKLDEAALGQFIDAYYGLIGEAPLKLIAAVVDKVHMQEVYSAPRSPWYAPAMAYEVLAQRLALDTVAPDTVAVVIDDMSGATPKGNQYKDNLRAHHEGLCTRGSRLVREIRFDQFERKLSFQDSAKSHLLQVADVVSYNVYRQFVEHGDAWEVAAKSLPTYEYFARVAKKFRTDGQGRIQGYGIIKAPLVNRVHWALQDDGKAK